MGTTVFGGLGPGLGGTVNPFDPDFERLALIAKNQALADDRNRRAAETYKANAARILEENVQQLANHLPLLTLLPPPHKRILTPDGLTEIDGVELVCDPISVVPSTVGIAPNLGVIASPNPVADRTDLAIAMLRQLNLDIQLIKSKLGI